MKISTGKVTLTEWDGETMYAVSFELSDNTEVGLFKKLLEEGERKLFETIFKHKNYEKRIKKVK